MGKIGIAALQNRKGRKDFILIQCNTDKCVSFIRVEAIIVNVLCIRSRCLTHSIFCTAAISLQRLWTLTLEFYLLWNWKFLKLFRSHIRTLCLNHWWFLNSFTVMHLCLLTFLFPAGKRIKIWDAYDLTLRSTKNFCKQRLLYLT